MLRVQLNGSEEVYEHTETFYWKFLCSIQNITINDYSDFLNRKYLNFGDAAGIVASPWFVLISFKDWTLDQGE